MPLLLAIISVIFCMPFLYIYTYLLLRKWFKSWYHRTNYLHLLTIYDLLSSNMDSKDCVFHQQLPITS